MAGMRHFPGPPDVLGEGPLWNDAAGRLEWVDVLGETTSSSRPDGSDIWRTPLPGGPTGTAFRASGGRVYVSHHRLILEDEDGMLRDVEVSAFDADREWFNDFACDALGRLFVGTLASDFGSNHGKLYRLDADLAFTTVDAGFVIANGIGWSPDGTSLYLVDTCQALFAYDYDIERGVIGQRRVFATFQDVEGHPDGLAVDVEGGIWIAMPGGGQLIRLMPNGTIDRRVATPTRWPTSVAFGGPYLETLFVTTMRPLDGTAATLYDGLVYAFEPGVPGLQSNQFGG